MNDQDLLKQFTQNTLSPEDFDHRNHLRLAWLFLRAHPLPEAMIKLRNGLQALTKRLGVPDKYHETITFWLLILISNRMAGERSFDDFLETNRDLLDNCRQVLSQYYEPSTLDSDEARQRLVQPDYSLDSVPLSK